MLFLVQMSLASAVRPTSTPEGIAFIEHIILPTLDRSKKLQEQGAIVAGGAKTGAIALVFIVEAASAQELDELIASLPVWARMETEVTPLQTFAGRERTVRNLLERLNASNEGGER